MKELLDRLLEEQRLTLSQLAREQGVAPCTVWRWVNSGAKGTKLETFRIGGRHMTTREAFKRFVAASSGMSVETPPSRKKSIAAAERALAKAGI